MVPRLWLARLPNAIANERPHPTEAPQRQGLTTGSVHARLLISVIGRPFPDPTTSQCASLELPVPDRLVAQRSRTIGRPSPSIPIEKPRGGSIGWRDHPLRPL